VLCLSLYCFVCNSSAPAVMWWWQHCDCGVIALFLLWWCYGDRTIALQLFCGHSIAVVLCLWWYCCYRGWSDAVLRQCCSNCVMVVELFWCYYSTGVLVVVLFL
jgi:hypothetical protein